MWELDYKESWVPKNWCFWTVVLEKTLESPLDCKEIQPVHPKGDQSWVFIGRTDVEAETPILWSPVAKSWVIWKDSDAGKDWGQEEKGMTKDEMVGWHHRLNEHESGWTPGVGDGQGVVASQRVRHNWATELNWTKEKVSCLPVKEFNKMWDQWSSNCNFWLTCIILSEYQYPFFFLKVDSKLIFWYVWLRRDWRRTLIVRLYTSQSGWK